MSLEPLCDFSFYYLVYKLQKLHVFLNVIAVYSLTGLYQESQEL